MKIIKPLEESGLLIKGTSEAIENEAKEQKDGFLSLLLGTLGAIWLENLFAGKETKAQKWGQGVIKAGDGVIQAGKGIIREGQYFYCHLIL